MAKPAFPALSAAVLLGPGRPAGDAGTRPLTVVMAGLPANDGAQVRAALEAAGHGCLPASTWPEAIAILSRVPADVLLQDLACPCARRFEGLKGLRGWPPPLSRLAVVALATEQERLLETTCIEAGYDALLTRPPAAEALEATLRRVVAARTPASPLDGPMRDALLGELGPEGRRAQDSLALDRAAVLVATLRTTPALPDVRDAAMRVAAIFAAVGAPAAVAAARALEAAPEQRPVLLPGLVDAVVAAKVALRRDR